MGERWFDLVIKDRKLKDNEEVKEWLAIVADRIQEEIDNKSLLKIIQLPELQRDMLNLLQKGSI